MWRAILDLIYYPSGNHFPLSPSTCCLTTRNSESRTSKKWKSCVALIRTEIRSDRVHVVVSAPYFARCNHFFCEIRVRHRTRRAAGRLVSQFLAPGVAYPWRNRGLRATLAVLALFSCIFVAAAASVAHRGTGPLHRGASASHSLAIREVPPSSPLRAIRTVGRTGAPPPPPRARRWTTGHTSAASSVVVNITRLPASQLTCYRCSILSVCVGVQSV
jgi:hypothetical protein